MVVRKSHWKRVKGHSHLFIWQRKLLVTFTPWALLWSTWICPNAPSEVCHPTCFTTSQTWWLQVTFQCGFWIDTVICSPDMSHNYLCSLPMSLAHHPSLEVVRLAGNLFTRFPALLDTLPRQTSPTCLLVSYKLHVCPAQAGAPRPPGPPAPGRGRWWWWGCGGRAPAGHGGQCELTNTGSHDPMSSISMSL